MNNEIDLLKLSHAFMLKVQDMTPPDKHRTLQLMMINSIYRRGSENIIQTDCSGLLSFPLIVMGYNVRLTADGFYREIYIHDVLREEDFHHTILAVFFPKDGVASHVAPIVGRHTILDAWKEGQRTELKDLESTRRWYIDNGYGVKVRELDWDRVITHSEGKLSEKEIDDYLKLLRRPW